MKRRLPFLSNSARRGLLVLEWLIILVVIGAVFAYLGGRRFVKKDLPL